MLAPASAPRVLVVEDERHIALLVKHTFERAGVARVDVVGAATSRSGRRPSNRPIS